jgi:hypothetical protein
MLNSIIDLLIITIACMVLITPCAVITSLLVRAETRTDMTRERERQLQAHRVISS